ncbi:Aspartic protease [Lachnellula occidentalis]|uniref:Aspartic protease n=1 Tax=Lachnellula occidentalis TaxID=215460 RepID=A0A8H8UCE6_9HELO|nr:Aspartic protease [Lachnellula occidentalis]
MYPNHLPLISLLPFAVSVAVALEPIHYPISRRGGSFPTADTANLTYLLEQLQIIETRFTATTREFSGNQVVRKPKRKHGTQANTILLGEVGREGNWFANLRIGDPPQNVDMDLDMLTADWWISSTSSDKGSYFLDFNSKTPAHQWLHSLLPSGAYLGLAPSTSLSQLKTVSMMAQLMEKEVIDTPVWSLVLLNREEGLFSIGGTSVTSLRKVERDTEDSLSVFEDHENMNWNEASKESYKTVDSSKEWKWLKVQGSDGWWQILMQGIWVDGVKVLQNQPVILDVNTPFMLAPPKAARSFYSSIAGSRRLPPPHDQFHSYPCLSPPQIHLEFASWNVEVMKGRNDRMSSALGGKFSLGRLETGSGYCIGNIVESRMGVEILMNGKDHETGWGGGPGVWIIGEPFFRDVQVAFDWKAKKVGLQKV